MSRIDNDGGVVYPNGKNDIKQAIIAIKSKIKTEKNHQKSAR
jgi:hypothetical protein